MKVILGPAWSPWPMRAGSLPVLKIPSRRSSAKRDSEAHGETRILSFQRPHLDTVAASPICGLDGARRYERQVISI